jgi:hypothetical protein
MQTIDLQEGEELVVGDVRVAVMATAEGVVVLRIVEEDDTRLEWLRVPAEAG